MLGIAKYERIDRRRGELTCPKCGSPIFETHLSRPWGSQTRLMVCRDPYCGTVLADTERRQSARPE